MIKQLGLDASLLSRLKLPGEHFERLLGQTLESEDVPTDGVVLVSAPGKATDRLREVRNVLRGTAYSAWLNDDGYGDRSNKIAILRGVDELAYLKMVYVAGPNYGIAHEQVLGKYIEWRKRYGMRLIGADMDWLSASISKPPENWKAFAAEVYEFCPDIVDQGTNTVDRLAEEMRKSMELFLWWD